MSPEFLNQVLPECESTNDLARKLGEAGCPHGSWVSALAQTRGRGRQGREWISQEGNLFLSMVVRPPSNVPVTWVPLLSAVAVTEAALSLDPTLPVRIKWPNDLVLARDGGFAKAGGILCEGVGSRDGSFVVVGLGLNCEAAPSVDQPSVSLGLALPAARAAVIAHLPGLFADFARAADRYAARSLLRPGQNIEWTEVSAGGTCVGEYVGLGKFGELRVRVPQGSAMTEKSLYSEEIRLRLRPA